MQAIVQALLPIFLLISLGFMLRRLELLEDSFWPQLERLTYYLLLPSLLISELLRAPLASFHVSSLALGVVLLLLLMTALLYALERLFPQGGAAFGALYQGAIRFNTYVGIAAASALYGNQGSALAALLLVLLIPLLNVLCVIVLSRAAGQLSPTALVAGIVRNPLIAGCVLGISLNLSALPLPYLDSVIALLGRAALPLGLLAVGAGLVLRLEHAQAWQLLLNSALKLLLMPLLALAIAQLIGLHGLERTLLVLFAALPTAPSAYILARLMGADAGLMAALITSQTLIALLSLPLWVSWLS